MSRPTPTGKFIVDFLNRDMPAYLDTGLNWVHVRDVAIGHILAAERAASASATSWETREGIWTMKEASRMSGGNRGSPGAPDARFLTWSRWPPPMSTKLYPG